MKQGSEVPNAFVLMPFGEGFDALYSDLLVPALERAGYSVARADSMIDQQNVLRDVITGVDQADLVVADMTGLNPNVFYELGVAHGLGVPTILITQALDEVPFDLRGYRVQEYSTRFDRASELSDTLREIAAEHSNGGVSFGSPISDFLPDSHAAKRLLDGKPERQPARRGPGIPGAQAAAGVGVNEDEGSDDETPQGFLDLVVAINEALLAVPAIAAEIAGATERIGKKVERHTVQVEKLSSGPQSTMLSEAHRIATRMADDLDGYSRDLRGPITRLHEQASILEDAAPALASRLNPSDEDQRDQLVSFRDALTQLHGSVTPTIGQLSDYRNEFSSLRGVTTKLDQAVDRSTSQLDRLISTLATFDAFSSRGIEIVNEKLDDISPAADG